MRTLLLLLASSLWLGACSLNRPAVERQSFLIHPERTATVTAGSSASLKIGTFEVVTPFSGRNFIYRRDDQRFETDFYNEYAADPGEMLAAATADWLRHSGLFKTVLDLRSPGPARQRLDVTVSAFYVDFRSPQPAAVLAVRWHLTRTGGAPREVASEERVPLAVKSPAGAAQAQREALARALAGLEAALR